MTSENVKPKSDSVEYLKRVLNRWGAFCKGHQTFEKAISGVLLENMLLRERVEELENQLEKLKIETTTEKCHIATFTTTDGKTETFVFNTISQWNEFYEANKLRISRVVSIQYERK